MISDQSDLNNIMKQAQKIQEKMLRVQEEISKLEITGESGASLVKVTINGIHNCRRVEIDSNLFKESDKKILEDLIAAAFNDAAHRIHKIQKEKISFIQST